MRKTFDNPTNLTGATGRHSGGLLWYIRSLRSTFSLLAMCSRQIWAGRFSPVAACRQHWSLNSLVWFSWSSQSLSFLDQDATLHPLSPL